MTTITSDPTTTETEDRLAILELERTADGWRIAGLTFTVQWATGNMHIVTLAAAGPQP